MREVFAARVKNGRGIGDLEQRAGVLVGPAAVQAHAQFAAAVEFFAGPVRTAGRLQRGDQLGADPVNLAEPLGGGVEDLLGAAALVQQQLLSAGTNAIDEGQLESRQQVFFRATGGWWQRGKQAVHRRPLVERKLGPEKFEPARLGPEKFEPEKFEPGKRSWGEGQALRMKSAA